MALHSLRSPVRLGYVSKLASVSSYLINIMNIDYISNII